MQNVRLQNQRIPPRLWVPKCVGGWLAREARSIRRHLEWNGVWVDERLMEVCFLPPSGNTTRCNRDFLALECRLLRLIALILADASLMSRWATAVATGGLMEFDLGGDARLGNLIGWLCSALQLTYPKLASFEALIAGGWKRRTLLEMILTFKHLMIIEVH